MSPRTVRIHVTNYNTALAVELCIRSLRERAGHPFELVVGDSGSTDGSVERLREFERRGWLELHVDPEGNHARWIDRWRGSCPTELAVFLDSDVEIRRHGCIARIVDAATRTGAALVAGEMLPENPFFIEPVSGRAIRGAPRPSSWMFLVDVAQTRDVTASFAFQSEETDRVPEGVIAWDVGGRFYAELQERGLGTFEMPRRFRRTYHHYSGLSWFPDEGEIGRRKAKSLRTIERRLAGLRSRQDAARA